MSFAGLIILQLLFVAGISVAMTVVCRVKLKSFALAIPCWLMFFWLFKGAIDFILASQQHEHLRYFDELFTLKVDSTYFIAISMYLLYFMGYVVVLLGYVLLTKRCFDVEKVDVGRHFGFLLIFSTLFTLLYVKFGVTAFTEAIKLGMSAYEYSRFHTGAEKPIMVLVSWLALLSALIGLACKSKIKWVFVVLVLVVFVTSAVLGNRHILISGVIFCFVFYFDKQRFDLAKSLKVIAVIVFSFSAIMSIYVVREMDEPSFDAVDWAKVSNAIVKMSSSSEFVYAHMSMYGVLDKDVEPNWGASFMFLGSSVLPRFVLDNRQPDIYSYYIDNVRPNIQKGFSISNPTGWYLNFHVPGVALGGMLLGVLCVGLFHLSLSRMSQYRLFFGLMFAIFISDVVGFLRSGGPEPLRAVLLIKTVVPAVLIYVMLKLRLRHAK